jgi:transcriptional regulator with XRE-family HTH domain
MSCQVQTKANVQLAKIRKLPAWYLQQAAEAMAKQSQTLGERIRSARKELHLRQKDIAAAIHVEPLTVSRWERDEHTPDFTKIELLAGILKKPVSFLVDAPKERAPDDPVLIEIRGIRAAQGQILDELAALRKERAPDSPARSRRAGGRSA